MYVRSIGQDTRLVSNDAMLYDGPAAPAPAPAPAPEQSARVIVAPVAPSPALYDGPAAVAPPPEQVTRTIVASPSPVAPQPVGPAYDYSRTGGGGGGQQQMTAFAASTFQAPTCLSAAQVAYLVDCAANPGTEDCQALLGRSGMPLCAGEELPLPKCRDAIVQASIAYCDQYGANGPDAGKNGVCWAAGKDPEWYQSLKALPACPGTEVAADETKKKTLMWGGILLAVAVVGGGIYWYSKKK